MIQWVNAIRPFCGVVTSLLVIVSFNVTGLVVNWYVVVAVFCITSTAMLLNDFYDRELDLGKGKTLATQYSKSFFFYSGIFTVASFALSILVMFQDSFSGIVLLVLLTVAIIYNYIQSVPVIKNLSIGLATGAVLLFPLFDSDNNHILWLMASMIVVIVSAREYIKDVEDMEVDRGKKRTLALLMNSQMSKRAVRQWKSALTLSLIGVILVGFLL